MRLNLPNRITLARILLVPILVYLLLFLPDRFFSCLAATLIVLASLSDVLDGYLARRYKQVTKLGKLLDPIADKLILIAAIIPLIQLQRVPAWMGVLLLGREMAVTGLRVVAAGEGVVISASFLGKQKATLEVIAMVLLILHFPLFGFDLGKTGMVVLILALIAAVVSGVQYFTQFIKALPGGLEGI